jgi:hypothetical protein
MISRTSVYEVSLRCIVVRNNNNIANINNMLISVKSIKYKQPNPKILSVAPRKNLDEIELNK